MGKRDNEAMHEELAVDLTDDEVRLRGQELAARLSDLHVVEEEKKEAAAAWKEKVDEVQADVERLAQAVRDRSELRQVECVERRNDEMKTMELVRLDTQVIVRSRGMTEKELQHKLHLIEDHTRLGRSEAGD